MVEWAGEQFYYEDVYNNNWRSSTRSYFTPFKDVKSIYANIVKSRN